MCRRVVPHVQPPPKSKREKWVVSVVYFKLEAPMKCKHMALKITYE